MVKHSIEIYSQHFDELWVSALTTILHREKFLWPRVKTAVIYGWKHKYLADNLTTCGLAKQQLLVPPSVTSWVMGSWSGLHYQAWIHCCGCLKSHPSTLCYPTAFMLLLYQQACLARKVCIEYRDTIDVFSPTGACRAPSSTTELASK